MIEKRKLSMSGQALPRKRHMELTELNRPGKALRWLRINECPGGGIVAYGNSVQASPGLTAALLSTLSRNGEHDLTRRGLQWLLDAQDQDGGYSSWKSNTNRFFETVSVLRGLTQISQSHLKIENTVYRAAEFIYRSLTDRRTTTSPISRAHELIGLGALCAANSSLDISDFLDQIEERGNIDLAKEDWQDLPLDTICELMDALENLNRTEDVLQ